MKSWLKRLEALASKVFKPKTALQTPKDVGYTKEPDKNRYYTEEEVAGFTDQQVASVVLTWMRVRGPQQRNSLTKMTYVELADAFEGGDAKYTSLFQATCGILRKDPSALAFLANDVRFGEVPRDLGERVGQELAFKKIADQLSSDNLPSEPTF